MSYKQTLEQLKSSEFDNDRQGYTAISMETRYSMLKQELLRGNNLPELNESEDTDGGTETITLTIPDNIAKISSYGNYGAILSTYTGKIDVSLNYVGLSKYLDNSRVSSRGTVSITDEVYGEDFHLQMLSRMTKTRQGRGYYVPYKLTRGLIVMTVVDSLGREQLSMFYPVSTTVLHENRGIPSDALVPDYKGISIPHVSITESGQHFGQVRYLQTQLYETTLLPNIYTSMERSTLYPDTSGGGGLCSPSVHPDNLLNMPTEKFDSFINHTSNNDLTLGHVNLNAYYKTLDYLSKKAQEKSNEATIEEDKNFFDELSQRLLQASKVAKTQLNRVKSSVVEHKVVPNYLEDHRIDLSEESEQEFNRILANQALVGEYKPRVLTIHAVLGEALDYYYYQVEQDYIEFKEFVDKHKLK